MLANPHLPNRQRLSAQVALYRGYSDCGLFDLGTSSHWTKVFVGTCISMIIESVVVSGSLSYYTGGRVGEIGKHWQIHSKNRDILQYSLEGPQKLTAFYWSKWKVGKINPLLSIMSRFWPKKQGILSNGRSWNREFEIHKNWLKNWLVLKGKINYQAKLTAGRTGPFLDVSLLTVEIDWRPEDWEVTDWPIQNWPT